MFTASRIHLVPILAVLVMAGLFVSPANAAAPDRLVWSYEGGFFKDQGTDGWVEKNTSGEYHFVEARRNRDFIELQDDSRDFTICRSRSRGIGCRRCYVGGFGLIV